MKARNPTGSRVFVQNTLCDAPVNFRLSQQKCLTCSLCITGKDGILNTANKGFDATDPSPTHFGAGEGLTGPFQGRLMIGHNNETLAC
jgi:hypothetical protein